MIRLAVRLALGGGREQVSRLAVTAVGVALGTVLMLLAAVVYPAIHAHEVRDAWLDTSAANSQPGADPVLWRLRVDTYAGQDFVRVDVAPLGPRPPLPPGLSRLPGPGELTVSPAMRALLARVPRDQLGDRVPGRITGTVGDAGLRYPGSLVVFVGYDPAQLRGQPGVAEVRGIQSQPRTLSLTRFGRVIVGMGGAALLVPILVLVGTATRLSAARREQRLAAMRLVGATPRQVVVVAVTEAALGALAGTVAGFGLFFVLRPYAARYDVDGSPFFASDLRLSLWAGALVGFGVPVLAAVAALLSLRRVRISPLGVSRQAAPGRPTWRRLIPLGASILLFTASLPALASSRHDSALWMIAAGIALLVAGIVVAGPWLTIMVGRLLTTFSRRTSAMLAGHRLMDNPTAGFRSISGLVLAVFLVTIGSIGTAIAVRPHADRGQVPLPAHAVTADLAPHRSFTTSPAQVAALSARLRALPGVTGVLALHWPKAGAIPGSLSGLRGVASCAELRQTKLAACAGTSTVVGVDIGVLTDGFVQLVAPPAIDGSLERLPVIGIVATTDGRMSTVEQVRTAMEEAAPMDWLPWTTEEIKGNSHKQSNQYLRISDAVLLASLLIAGFSLAISVAGGLVERKRPFALLRLSGMRLRDLRAVLLAETAGPLLCVALVSVALGMAVMSYTAWVSHVGWAPPAPSYWLTLGAGLVLALAVAVGATLPLLGRLTSLETARFE